MEREPHEQDETTQETDRQQRPDLAEPRGNGDEDAAETEKGAQKLDSVLGE